MLKKKMHQLVISGLFTLSMVTESFAGIVVTQFEILSPPTNSLFSDVFGVNSTGQVVGRSYTSDFSERATLWNNGVATYLATPGGTGNRANWINNSGKVVGLSTFANGEQRATLWHNGNATDLGPAGEPSSEAKGINGSGQIVGYGSADINAGARAILWSADGVPSDLGNPLGAVASRANAINDAGQVVGIAFDRDFQQRATLWSNGVATELTSLGGPASVANGINNSGQIVGWAYQTNFDQRATLWHNGTVTNLGTFGGNNSEATGINNLGQVVGWAQASTGDQYAAMWDGTSIINLSDLASSVTGNTRLSYVAAISDIDSQGRFWVAGVSGRGVFRMQLENTSTVPEPGTIALFGLSLAGIGFIARRKNRRTA